MSRSPKKRGLSPAALFDTSEGAATEDASGGTEVLGGLVSEEAVLVVESGRHAGERVVLGAGTCVIGRSSKCALVLRRSAGVSRRHTKIRYVGGTYELDDCGSRNGTRVNGKPVAEGYPLNDGDLIQISDERVRYRGPSGRTDPADTRGLLADPVPLERRLPSREQPGEIVRTQRVRVDSPDSLLHTKDGGTAPDRPLPPPTSSRRNPVIPARTGALPSSPTALFTSQLQALSTPQPPPVVMPPTTTLPAPAPRPARKAALFVFGVVLGVAVLVGGVATWDLTLNGGRVTDALVEDAALVWGGMDAALDAAPTDEAPVDEAPVDEAPAEEAPVEEAPPVVATASVDDVAASAPEPVDDEPPAVEVPRVREEPPAPEPAAQVVEVKADVGGRVRSVAVAAGAQVRVGDTLLVVDRSSPRITRKLTALRKEEQAFARHAALGNARATRDLEEVRREIARLERRAGTAEVTATVAGRVDGLLVDVGGRVRRGAVVVRIAVTN